MHQKNIPDGAFVVVSKESLILLVRHAYGNKDWSFPGGGVEEGESAQVAALRECAEETGYSPHIAIMIAKYKSRKYVGQMTHLYHVFLQAESRPSPIEHSREIKETRWVNILEAQKLLTLPAQRRFLATYQAYLANKNTQWRPYSEWLSGELANKDIGLYEQSLVTL